MTTTFLIGVSNGLATLPKPKEPPMRTSSFRRLKKQAIDKGETVNCGICGEPITIKDRRHPMGLTTDHIIPKSLGGINDLSNFQPAHKSCNHKKGSKMCGRENCNNPATHEWDDTPYCKLHFWIESGANE